MLQKADFKERIEWRNTCCISMKSINLTCPLSAGKGRTLGK
ncbi:hypothetical protein CHCC14813_1136 [Bacillus licheniformis]|nr:hypothetical protein CHCC14813_1136 [Bacillus licheniformis]TWN64397.1 hypothetical protein CHCC14437_3685 [Bacillus licheniformis]